MSRFTQRFVDAVDSLLSAGELAAHFTDVRTDAIGVSANVADDFTVASGESNETRIPIADTSHPWFDDFGELDAEANAIVIEHDSHHEIVANAHLASSSGPGQVVLRVKVNGETRAVAESAAKNDANLSTSASIYLKLEAGDEVTATLWHNTGSTETFDAVGGNYISCVRQ